MGTKNFFLIGLFYYFQQNYGKKNIYNLNEDEELTHYGQSLAEIEKLNDIIDSDSDTEERGTLSGKTCQLASHCWCYCWYMYIIHSVLSFNEKEYYVIDWEV